MLPDLSITDIALNEQYFVSVRVKIMAPALGKEDCALFNPPSIAVKQIQGDWRIVDGSHRMSRPGGFFPTGLFIFSSLFDCSLPVWRYLSVAF